MKTERVFVQMWGKKYGFGQNLLAVPIFFHIFASKYLVISRADKIIHLIEMKFCETPFVIKKDYEEKLKNRKSLFMEVTEIARGPVFTFITPMGLSPGSHTSIVHSQLTAKHLFANIL